MRTRKEKSLFRVIYKVLSYGGTYIEAVDRRQAVELFKARDLKQVVQDAVTFDLIQVDAVLGMRKPSEIIQKENRAKPGPKGPRKPRSQD